MSGSAEIVELLVSGRHRYEGRPGATLQSWPDERVSEIQVRAGLGVVGDRYFNRSAHRDAAITLMAAEALDALLPLASGPVDLRQVRRNVLLRGVDVDAAAGRVLGLRCENAEPPVLLWLRRPARPCAWLDTAIGAGAWRALRERGGMRCQPLTDGRLRVGPVQVSWSDPPADRPGR